MRATRRTFLGAVAAGFAGLESRIAHADVGNASDVEVRDIALPGDRSLGQRMALVIPKKIVLTSNVPLLVLLHGLGETGDQRTGAFAWIEKYGLTSSIARLYHPPITRTSKRGDFTDEHLRAVNADLTASPFAGFVIACPYTPNVNRAPNLKSALDGYTQWIVDVVIPQARREASIATDAARIAIDGCSLGGFVAIEVFLRSPQTFGALGAVQAAIGKHRAAPYADRFANVIKQYGPRAIHIETSSADPFREANETLAAELTKRLVTHETIVLPGPHDQPWLREVGTLEMLRWHDRRFRRAMGKP
jgi:predicted esterase